LKTVLAAGTFLMLSLYSINGYSQEPVGPELAGFIDDGIASPTAAGLGQYGSIPINMSTGVPGISIPITTVNAGNISLPVSLNYNASGIKVTEEPGPVGLGWSLNAGGVITRIVRGHPDELDEGPGPSARRGYYATLDSLVAFYTPTSQGGMNLERQEDFLMETARNKFDTEPDVYFYNFSGKSGFFVLDGQDGYVTFPDANLKLEHSATSNGISWFKITDEDGTIYRFFKTETTVRQQSDIESPFPDFPLGSLQTFYGSYTSAWYLTHIEHPQQSHYVKFDYSTVENTGAPQEYLSSTSFTHHIGYLNTNCDESGPISPSFSKAKVEDFVRLDHIKIVQPVISKVDTIVTINYLNDSNNQPLGYRIENIRVNYPDTGERKKLFYLNFDQFPGSNNDDYLLLEDIQEIRFPGNHWTSPYKFEYYSGWGTLFSRHSPRRDFLGYQTNRNADHLMGLYEPYGDNVSISYGVSREPNLNYTKTGVLKKITYPTGGSTTFDYELNTANLGGDANRPIGGLRVKEIIDHPGDVNATVTKTYTYGPGSVSSNSLRNVILHGFDRRLPRDYYTMQGEKCQMRMGASEASMTMLGHFVQYDYVKEIIDGGNGGAITESYLWHGHGADDGIYRNSLLRERAFINSVGEADKKMSTDYHVRTDASVPAIDGQKQSIVWLRPDIQRIPNGVQAGVDSIYVSQKGGSYRTEWAFPQEKTEAEFKYEFIEGEDCQGPWPDPPHPPCEVIPDKYEVIETLPSITEFTYGKTGHKQPTAIRQINSTGEWRETFIYYANEVYPDMKSNHMLIQPYSVMTRDSTETILKHEWMLWDEFNDFWQPSQRKQWTGQE